MAIPLVKGSEPVQAWRSTPGCPDCRRHVVFVIRGATQLACRLKTLGNQSRNWTLRATRSSDEGRFPFGKRRSAGTTARRRVGGHPDAECSVDLWPGAKTCRRPEASRPVGEPQAEPSASVKTPVVPKKGVSAHAKKCDSPGEYHSPPSCAEERLYGKGARAPKCPLCDLGRSRDEVEKLRGRPGAREWRGAEFQLGRAPFDSRYCAVWRALFESFAPAERALAPVYRFLIRSRGAKLCGEAVPDSKAVYQAAFGAVWQTFESGVCRWNSKMPSERTRRRLPPPSF